jgi:cystathionine beta-lyase/cystathionine gamma-synthase
VAKWLESHPQVERVHYPGLKSHPAHELAQKYMRLVDDDEPLFGFMLAVEIAEEDLVGLPKTRRFYDGLEMIWRATDLGRVKTVATLNAISTHQQQGEVGRSLASLRPNTVRISVGIEDPEDIIRDLERGFAGLNAFDQAFPQKANQGGQAPAFSYHI